MSPQTQKIPVIAVFDVGKTNKKFLLFNMKFEVLQLLSRTFDEIKDEDGFPTENIEAIEDWMKDTLHNTIREGIYEIKFLNFSAYGASWVHLDKQQKRCSPLYNYLKVFPAHLSGQFFQNILDKSSFELETSSPFLGMLNSGLQLYWIKHQKPDLFAKIHYSLHLPQYFSWIFTQKPCSEYTGIGCHTGLWAFEKQDYHPWVKSEGLKGLFPEMARAEGFYVENTIFGQSVKIGSGLHDSSAALVPYLKSEKKPFAVISTGTWSISMNPFQEKPLNKYELERDCLHFLNIRGSKVKAARLFLGEELKQQLQLLNTYFHRNQEEYLEVPFDPLLFQQILQRNTFVFPKKYLNQSLYGFPESTSLVEFKNFEEAYHQLIFELVQIQIASLKLVIGNSEVYKIFLEGGFSNNEVFVGMLRWMLPEYFISPSEITQGSALGAAMTIFDAYQEEKNTKSD